MSVQNVAENSKEPILPMLVKWQVSITNLQQLSTTYGKEIDYVPHHYCPTLL